MIFVLLLLLSSFDVFVPTSAHSLLILEEWFVQICLYVTLLMLRLFTIVGFYGAILSRQESSPHSLLRVQVGIVWCWQIK